MCDCLHRTIQFDWHSLDRLVLFSTESHFAIKFKCVYTSRLNRHMVETVSHRRNKYLVTIINYKLFIIIRLTVVVVVGNRTCTKLIVDLSMRYVFKVISWGSFLMKVPIF